MQKQQIAAIYTRISKEDMDKSHNGDDSESIQNQKLLLMDYAVSNNFLIHNIYVDEDMSGFSDRPSFKRMIEDAANGLFNTIICKSQSRFTRDMELVEKYIHGHFVEWGIRFISLTDNVDTDVKGNKKARQIYGLINEWYSEDLSENIKAVFRKKMEAGQFIGAFACYGYEKDAKDRHKLVVDEEAAAVVREIYSLYLQGHGVVGIASALTERGVPTPTMHKKEKGLRYFNPGSEFCSEKHRAWSCKTIARILRNEAYIGTLTQGMERKISYKSKKSMPLPRSDWVVIKNNHTPIVDEDVFHGVQKLMDRKRRGRSFSKGYEEAKPHVLAGKLLCADCGSAMQRSGLSGDGKTRYLRCRLSAMTKKKECTPHYISQNKIERAIIDKIRGFIQDASDCESSDGIIKAAISETDKVGGGDAKIKKQLLEIKVKIETLQTNIAMAYADKVAGSISREDFMNFKEMFEQERQNHIINKEFLEKQLAGMDVRRNAYENIDAALEELKEIDVLSHEIVNIFVDTIYIGEKNTETKEQSIVINWLL